MTYQKKPRQKYIRCLERRAEYLEKRIGTSKLDLSYDKAETNALRWAINTLRDLYPNSTEAPETVSVEVSTVVDSQEAEG